MQLEQVIYSFLRRWPACLKDMATEPETIEVQATTVTDK